MAAWPLCRSRKHQVREIKILDVVTNIRGGEINMEKQIREIANIMKDIGLTLVEVTREGTVLHLERNPAAAEPKTQSEARLQGSGPVRCETVSSGWVSPGEVSPELSYEAVSSELVSSKAVSFESTGHGQAGSEPESPEQAGSKRQGLEFGQVQAERTEANAVEKIESPMVGIFYEAQTPEDQPFVKVGDYVEAGDVVCLIEAMKLFNEITAEAAGRVTEICVTNGQVVEYGQVLMKLVRE